MSKRDLRSKIRFVISVCESIIKWNEGEHGRKLFLESLNVKCGPNIIAGLRKENNLRLSNARCKITENYKKRRQVLHQLRKQNKKGDSYTPGGFSTEIIPYVDFTRYKNKMCAIQSPSDVDVQAFITDLHSNWYFNEIYILSKQLKVTHNLFPILL